MEKMDIRKLDELADPWWSEHPTWRSYDIGPGWMQLVADLITELAAVDDTWRITQIKSKFGGLRFYISGGGLEIDELIDRTEKKSYTLCEECGAPGELLRINSWYYTLCPEHIKSYS